jgi:hypothetical protein
VVRWATLPAIADEMIEKAWLITVCGTKCECSLLSITTVFDRPDRNALFLGKIQNRETEIEGLCQICHKAKLFKLA